MKKMKLLAFALVSTTLIFTSCKKDDKSSDDNGSAASKSSLLVDKDWIMVGSTLTASPGGTIDVYANMDPCDKDDLTRFNTDKSITLKAGATKCDPTDPDTEPGGTWAFVNSETKLRIIDGDTTDADLVELTASSLKLKIVTDDAGVTYTTNVSFSKN